MNQRTTTVHKLKFGVYFCGKAKAENITMAMSYFYHTGNETPNITQFKASLTLNTTDSKFVCIIYDLLATMLLPD